jgi:H+/Cl- antiporter ClcA
VPELILLAAIAIAVIGYVFSRRYTDQAVYRRRRRRERAEYDAVMASRREAEDSSRLP